MQTTGPQNLDKALSERRGISSTITTTSINSSLQKVWAGDYYNNENMEEQHTLSFEPDTPSHLRSQSQNHPSTTKDQSNLPRALSQQRSLSQTRSNRTRANSRSLDSSPLRQNIDQEFMATFTADKNGRSKLADKSKGGLASWFTGASAAGSVGTPIGDKELPPPPTMSSSRSTSLERPVGKLKKRPTLPNLHSINTITPAKQQTSVFSSFFSPKTPATNTVRIPAEFNDEFLELDVTAALFPQGSPRDAFSPASFNNLLMNAEGLLLKLQTAYKVRTLSLHEISLDKSAMEEELEEATTRTQCLKTQLEGMAAKAQEQDTTIAELATQLAIEKNARREEREAQIKSNAKRQRQSAASDLAQEDLGIANASSPMDRKNWRGSADLSTEGESDNESGADSVFSRSRSPTFTMSSMSTRDGTPEIHQAAFARMLPNTNLPSQRSKVPPQQKSTFQKIMSGISPTATNPIEERDGFGGIGMGMEGCSNCRGKDASIAWDTVGLLRAENQGLKQQVSAMQDGIEGALAVCYGYGS